MFTQTICLKWVYELEGVNNNGERCYIVLLWRSRNILWTTKLYWTFHQHESELTMIEFPILGELVLLKVYHDRLLIDINDITYTWHTGSPLTSQAGWCLLKRRQSADNKEPRDLILPLYIQRRKETENLPLKMRKVVCGRSSNQCSPLRRALTTDTCMLKTTTRTFGVNYNWAVHIFSYSPSI